MSKRITMQKASRLLVRDGSSYNYVARVEAAARAYKAKYKQEPTLCYLSPAVLGQLQIGILGDLFIMPSKQVAADSILMGMRKP